MSETINDRFNAAAVRLGLDPDNVPESAAFALPHLTQFVEAVAPMLDADPAALRYLSAGLTAWAEEAAAEADVIEATTTPTGRAALAETLEATDG